MTSDRINRSPQHSRPRNQRRPALACDQCRKRKIRCDRAHPCHQCVKADIVGCLYVEDEHESLIAAPFKGEDTRFSVFHVSVAPRRSVTAASAIDSASKPGRSSSGNSSPERTSATAADDTGTHTFPSAPVSGPDPAVVSGVALPPLLPPVELPSASDGADAHDNTDAWLISALQASVDSPLDWNFGLADTEVTQMSTGFAGTGLSLTGDERSLGLASTAFAMDMEMDLDLNAHHLAGSSESGMSQADLMGSTFMSADLVRNFVSESVPHSNPNAVVSAETGRISDLTDLEQRQQEQQNQWPPSSVSLRHELLESTYRGSSYSSWFAYESPAFIKAVHDHRDEVARCLDISASLRTEIALVRALGVKEHRCTLPSRAVANQLVQAYLRTLQPLFGVLHVAAFRRQYAEFWDSPGDYDETFTMMLTIVLSIGATFCRPSISQATAQGWINAVIDWVRSSVHRPRLDMDYLRVMTLVLIAHHVQPVHDEKLWLSSGILLRTAMRLGLHDNGAQSAQTSLAEAEAQRRLWAAIVELDLQISMDDGHVPGCQPDDYTDAALPSNVDDASLESAADNFPGSISSGTCSDNSANNNNSSNSNDASHLAKHPNIFTQSSFQVLLMKTAPVRLQIARLLNRARSQRTCAVAQSLSVELSALLAECTERTDAFCMSSMPPTPFQIKMFWGLVRRFAVAVSLPFAVRTASSMSDDSGDIFHSGGDAGASGAAVGRAGGGGGISSSSQELGRAMGLASSIQLLSHLALPAGDQDFRSFLIVGRSAPAYTQAALFLCRQLLLGDIGAGRSDTPMGNHASSGEALPSRAECLQALTNYLSMTQQRLASGAEQSIKAFALVSCSVAQVEAAQKGADEVHAVGCHCSASGSSQQVDDAVAQALRNSLKVCEQELRAQLRERTSRE